MERRTAIVTGASRGLGRAISLALATAGWTVIAVARSSEQLTELCDDITARGFSAVPRVGDVSDPEALRTLVQDVDTEFGPITGFVGNAGVNPIFKDAVDVTPDEFDQIFNVNARGSFFAATAVLRTMIARGSPGSIVLVGSVGADVPIEKNAVYCMSKSALVHLTRVLSLEAAPYGVRVNAVNPGFLATDLTAGVLRHPKHRGQLERAIPLGRIGQTDDVARSVRHLLSDDAAYVTGTTVTIDGGYSLRRGWPAVRPAPPALTVPAEVSS
jgi:NAD(P)-dependent dehydrogenase (short-subunit alcohol dehydrogenase family)